MKKDSKNKSRYYYFQLWEGFFKNKIIKRMCKLPSGDSIIVCYQRMVVATLNTDGWFEYEGLEETLISEIALEIDESEETVKFTMAALMKYGLAIQNEDASAIQILIIPEIMKIGSEGESAKRMRKKREMEKVETEEQKTRASQCAHIVQKCAIDIDKEIDIESEINTEIVSSIIQFYNNIWNKSYMNNAKNQQVIKLALKQITQEQALHIIENEHVRFLNKEYGTFRPNMCWMFGKGLSECLDRIYKKKNKNKFNEFMKQTYDIAEIEAELLSN